MSKDADHIHKNGDCYDYIHVKVHPHAMLEPKLLHAYCKLRHEWMSCKPKINMNGNFSHENTFDDSFTDMMTSSNGNISALLPFVRGIHRSPVYSPHKGQWRGALMLSLICAWANNGDAEDLRRRRVHYDVIVMTCRHLVQVSVCYIKLSHICLHMVMAKEINEKSKNHAYMTAP